MGLFRRAVLVATGLVVLVGVDRGVAWMVGRPREWRHSLASLFQWVIQLGLSVVLSLLTLSVLAYSRRREFAADRRAATVSGNPIALARALVKIEQATAPRRGALSLLYVQRDQADDARRLLSTHPPLSERVERLVEMADSAVSRHRLERLRG